VKIKNNKIKYLKKELGFFGPNVRKNNIWEGFLPHLQYRQIWLNMLMDYGYLSNITKLEKKIH